MFRSICNRYPKDSDMPERAWVLARLRQVLDGTIYDCLSYPFSSEYSQSNEYVKVHDRRPSVRYNMCNTVVQDSVSLLFGDGRFPIIHCADEPSRLNLAALVRVCGLDGVMSDAAVRGSVGSVVVRFRLLKGRPFFDVFDTDFLTPVWKADEPDTLESVTEKYKVRGRDLVGMGYPIDEKDAATTYWFQRRWTDTDEEWYLPFKVGGTDRSGKPSVPVLDAGRTVHHGLGFVPMVWIKNLYGKPGVDGGCTFSAAIDTQIEVEYQLSQAGRGLRYSSDPLLIVKEPAGTDQKVVRSAANAMVLDQGGDAKLLEISGSAAEAVISYVSKLREFALEAIRGNRSTPDKMGMAQSGRALELLHEPLIWLAGQLRGPYGAALLSLIGMVIESSRMFPVKIGRVVVEFPDDIDVTLRWGHWFDPTHHDNLEESQALSTAAEAGHISRESAVALTCSRYDLPDAPEEMIKVTADIEFADARATKLAAQTKAVDTLPG